MFIRTLYRRATCSLDAREGRQDCLVPIAPGKRVGRRGCTQCLLLSMRNDCRGNFGSNLFDNARCLSGQTNLHDKAATGPIHSTYAAPVQADGAVGDREPQADSSSLTLAGRIHAVKGAEKLVESELGNARAMIADANTCLAATRVIEALETHVHIGSLARVAHGIANDVFYRAMQESGITPDHAVIHNVADHATVPTLSFEVCIFDDALQQGLKVDFRHLSGSLTAFHPRQGEQAANQFIQTGRFPLNAVEGSGSLWAGALPGQSQSDIQPSQRRSQFVGDVVQQARLSIDQRFQSPSHTVEVTNQLRDFITATASQIASAGRQVAVGEPLSSRS